MSVKEILEVVRALSHGERAQVHAPLDTPRTPSSCPKKGHRRGYAPPGYRMKPPFFRQPAGLATRR